MHERELIERLSMAFCGGLKRENAVFACDAEIVRIGGGFWGMTMDEFSPGEDLFSDGDPGVLGANLVTATLSDLLAAGVEPAAFMHAVSLPRDVSRAFVDGFAEGVAGVLSGAGCSLCGGDVGQSEVWRYCGFAMGPVTAARPITRELPNEAVTLWVTGRLGDANLAAVRGGETPAFELRAAEAAVIRKHAVACIDSSGGFLDAVWTLHTVNADVCLDVDLRRVPLAEGVVAACAALGVAREAVLIGGAGEYELLCAVRERSDAGLRLRDAGLTCIGRAEAVGEAGVVLQRRDGRHVRMVDAPPSPRRVGGVDEHVRDVMRVSTELFGEVER